MIVQIKHFKVRNLCFLVSFSMTGTYSVQIIQFSRSVVSFGTQWIAACQTSLSITNSRNLLKFMSIESVMPSNHLILCRPLLFPPSVFPSIRVFSNELVFHIRWPKDWSFSFSISPSNGYSGLLSNSKICKYLPTSGFNVLCQVCAIKHSVGT